MSRIHLWHERINGICDRPYNIRRSRHDWGTPDQGTVHDNTGKGLGIRTDSYILQASVLATLSQRFQMSVGIEKSVARLCTRVWVRFR